MIDLKEEKELTKLKKSERSEYLQILQEATDKREDIYRG
jgi:hypothetical protein